MTRSFRDPDFDPRIASWLEGSHDQAPGSVLPTVLAAYPLITQRPARRWPWRTPTMNRFALIGATVLAVLVLGAGGIMLLSSGSKNPNVGGQPSPTQSQPVAPTGAIPSAAPTANGTVCRLLTTDEAKNSTNNPGLGSTNGALGNGAITDCIYSNGPGDVIVRLTLTNPGGSAAFDVIKAKAGVQPVADIGIDAVFDPAKAILYVSKGDAMVAITGGTPDQTPAARLQVESGLGKLIAGRL